MASTRNSSPPAEIVARVSGFLERHVRPGDRLVVAFSGGIDSMVLLHLLRVLSRSLGYRLSAFHVHHGLSPHAHDWLSFCERSCEALDIPLKTSHVDVGDVAASGLEAAARRVRYGAFAELDADWLVLAHQRDDQAETLLFNLLRGTGWTGAAAMPAVRDFPGRPGMCLLRPLLDVSRREIAGYARANKLTWIEDESNLDTRHARNFLRHDILPLLRERFPGCDAVLARAAGHFAEGESLFAQLAELDARVALRDGRIIVAELARLEAARARNLLRHVLKLKGVPMPDSARLDEALRQVCHAAADRRVAVDLGSVVLRRHRDESWLVPKLAPPLAIEWCGEETMDWGGAQLCLERVEGNGIALERLKGKPVTIRPRRGGERIRPDAHRPRRELKKLLQENGIPPWKREILPLLWCGEELVWVAGIGIDCAWQCRQGEAGLRPEWSAD